MKQIISIPAKVLEPVKNYLLSQQKKLKRRKKALKKEDPFSNPDRLNDRASPDTGASEQFGHERAKAMRGEVDKALIRIRKALTRIKLGKYGLCEDCKKMINTDRLAIDPSAQYCVSCQKKNSSKKEKTKTS